MEMPISPEFLQGKEQIEDAVFVFAPQTFDEYLGQTVIKEKFLAVIGGIIPINAIYLVIEREEIKIIGIYILKFAF